MQVRFSWMAYAIDKGGYGDWVDRGRLKPTLIRPITAAKDRM